MITVDVKGKWTSREASYVARASTILSRASDADKVDSADSAVAVAALFHERCLIAAPIKWVSDASLCVIKTPPDDIEPLQCGDPSKLCYLWPIGSWVLYSMPRKLDCTFIRSMKLIVVKSS